MPRMNIFNTLEQEAFEFPPLFNNAERLTFFFAPMMFSDSMESMRTPTNKVCFIVMAGYFKARRKFFARRFHQTDIEFVAEQIGLDPREILLKAYSKETCARQQRLILRHFGCSPFDGAARAFSANEIALPSYAILAGLIVAAIARYQRELGQIIDAHLTETQRDKLDALLLLVAGFPNHMNCPESHGGRGFQYSAPKTVIVDSFGGKNGEEPSI